MKEYSLLRDVDQQYIDMWLQCRKDPNCMGIVSIKGRGKPENHFADLLYSIRWNLLEGKPVVIISTNEKYIDAITEGLESYYQMKPNVDPHKNPEGSGSFSWTLMLGSMKYQKGKLYVSGTTTVLCTGVGLSSSRFSGVVVEQLDPISDHQVGNFSPTWSAHSDIFKESDKAVTIDPANWKDHEKFGDTNGPSK